MKSPDLSKLVTSFFLTHLAAERNVSHNTVIAYRDAWKLFLRFAADLHKRTIDALAIEDLTLDVVLAFLDSLEAAARTASTPVTPVLQPSTVSFATCLSVNPLSRRFASGF